MTFPIIIPVTAAALAEFHASEYGSWEDAGCPDAGHVCNILDRHARKIEVRDADEAELVYYAACSGTMQLAYKGFTRTARKIADALRPHVSARTAHIWRGPSGF